MTSSLSASFDCTPHISYIVHHYSHKSNVFVDRKSASLSSNKSGTLLQLVMFSALSIVILRLQAISYASGLPLSKLACFSAIVVDEHSFSLFLLLSLSYLHSPSLLY